MLCKEIINVLEAAYPGSFAMDWDNVGLLVGREDKEVRRIYVALDATGQVIRQAVAWRADMLITHHPMIFTGLKKINNRDFIGARVLQLIQNDISYYAMHTNYDVLGMAELSGKMMDFTDMEILEVTSREGEAEGIGRVADLGRPVSLGELCRIVKERFHLGAVKVFGEVDQEVKRPAISPGAGKSMIGAALDKQADVLITGDIDHHTGIDAVAQGLAVIDAGHYGIEHIFIEDVRGFLEKKLPAVEVAAAPVCHPFHII